MAISKKRLIKMIQDSKNRKSWSDIIAVGDSDLYDFAPARRAVLMMIAFMQQQDENKKTPEGSPFDKDYVGWTWCSQKFLACRVGCSERYIRECVGVFEKDGVIRVREWEDEMGYPHCEYQIIRAVVDTHKRPEGYLKEKRDQPRRGGNKKANAGSFKKGNHTRSDRNSQP